MGEDVEKLKQRLSLLDYLRQQNWVARPAGDGPEFVGLCPLHAETRPSFYVNRRLVVGTGTGALPVMEELKREAKRRKIELLILPTVRAIQVLERDPTETNPVLHVTC